MIKPFQYYIKENLVKRSAQNISMAKSLMEKAEIRFRRLNVDKIEENEASLVFEDIYECLREAAQSIMEINGYKPYSHEALLSFLHERKFLSEEKIHMFDNYRVIRNNSVYKAEKVSLEKCHEAKGFASQILPELDKKLKELLRENNRPNEKTFK